MRKHVTFLCVLVTFLIGQVYRLAAQTGPNNPGTRANDVSIGTNAWTNPANINTSNNVYATLSTKGISNYLSATNFGFLISVPSAVTGIVLEVERSTSSQTAVAILDNWTTGFSKTISAGSNRCLVVAVFMENGLGARDVTAITYGGQSMTQITEAVVGTSGAFCAKVEYWRLMESGIAAASSTSFNLTFDGTSLLENWEAVTSAVYQFVDQVIPVSDMVSLTSNSATNPITLSPAINTRTGGMTISGAICGNNTTPGSSVGGTNTYGINSSFTEVIDTYSANAGASTSGGSYEVAHKAAAAAGTEAPAVTFAGTVNRQLISCIHLQGIREADNSVRLIKGGVITGNNYAATTSAWPTVDAYQVYGSSTDLWGTTWTDAQINATNFGAVLSASVQNGIAAVDHMRITIYSHSTLPIELLDFSGESKGGVNYVYWQTAMEINNKEFVIERSADGIHFEEIATIAGKINSRVFNSYSFADKEALTGLSYYRLKQVDLDGSFKYFNNIALDNSGKAEELVVYPNPSYDGVFNLASLQTNNEGIYIYSSEMKLVKYVPAEGPELEISLQHLPDGTYYLTHTQQGTQKLKRLEKMSRSK